MASITTDRRGRRRIQFIGADRIRRAIRLGTMPIKDVQEIKNKVVSLNSAAISRTGWDNRIAEWVAGLKPLLYDKLAKVHLVPPRKEAERFALAGWLESYIKGRADVKPATATVYGHTQRCLIEFFGADRTLDSVTPADADAWRIWLGENQGLADNTVRRRCAIAKQFFRAALRKRLIGENPFADLKGIGVRPNRSRDFFLSRSDAEKILEACPDAEWRLIFALSRYAGLRCPSEHLALQWSDVNWELGRLTVHSSKTEHHGHESRDVPIFPELRPYLDALFMQPPNGNDFIIQRYRNKNANLRTQLERIIRKAGLKPWPKLFQNLRSSRATELAKDYPAHVAAAWLGHSISIANDHYWQVRNEDFQRANGGSERAAQKTAQHDAVSSQVSPHDSTENDRRPDATAEKPAKSSEDSARATQCITLNIDSVGATGLEPVTSAL